MAEWHEGLDPALIEHATAKGWIKEGVDATAVARSAVQAHLAAQKLIGVPAEQIVRLPKSPDDPAYAEAYKRVAEFGAPKDASGYSFNGVEGITEEDAKFVSELAAELKLPVNSAASVAQKLVSRKAAEVAANAEKTTISTAAEQAVLRQTWGSNYDLNLFRTQRVAEALGWDKDVVDKLNTTVGGTKVLNGLLQLAGKMSESTFLKGETTQGSGSITKEEARTRKEALKNDSAWVKRYLGGDAEARETITNLDRIILAR